MSDKVFWSILGVILVAVIGLFVGLVSPKMSTYAQKTKELDGRVKAMSKFAGNAPNELPSAALLEAKQGYEREWERSVAAARGFYESRETRIAGPVRQIGGNRANWVAQYRDAFADLATRYRQAHGLAEDAALPFAELEEPGPQADLVQAEKAWRVQSLLLEEVLAGGGEVISYTTQNQKARESQDKEDPRPGFSLDQVTLKAKVPPARLTGFLEKILGHEDLVLEIDRLVVGKDPTSLFYDIVQKKENGTVPDPVEPAVIISLTVNVLTWKPPPPPEP